MHFLIYSSLRIFGFFISLLPYSWIHFFGRFAGTCAYYLHRGFRKKAMSNLAIAFGETLSEKERRELAVQSFQNLMITCLEFFRLKKSKGNLSEIVELDENKEVIDLMNNKQGIIFLSGHQANWEIPFIALTNQFPGVAIGRPIKNKWLYHWVLSVREMNGGKIVMPKSAIKQGMKALKEGKFLGIVGDQAYPESPYSYPLFGTRAWTTSTPALLAYKTNSPIVVGTTKRHDGRYLISGSSPIWPDLSKPIKDEVPRLMNLAMRHLEESIRENPDQWMWVHDRWKQQEIDHVKREYRFGFILIVLPPNPAPFIDIIPLLRTIYPRSFLTFFVPHGNTLPIEDVTVLYYKNSEDLYVRDWRFQLVIDFYNSSSLRRFYHALGAVRTLHLAQMKKIVDNPEAPLAQIIKETLVKPECLHTVTS